MGWCHGQADELIYANTPYTGWLVRSSFRMSDHVQLFYFLLCRLKSSSHVSFLFVAGHASCPFFCNYFTFRDNLVEVHRCLFSPKILASGFNVVLSATTSVCRNSGGRMKSSKYCSNTGTILIFQVMLGRNSFMAIYSISVCFC